LGSLFEHHGHAESDSFFSLADMTLSFEPPVMGIEWTGRQVAAITLFERKGAFPKLYVGNLMRRDVLLRQAAALRHGLSNGLSREQVNRETGDRFGCWGGHRLLLLTGFTEPLLEDG